MFYTGTAKDIRSKRLKDAAVGMLGLWLVHVILCFYFPGSCEEMEEEEEEDDDTCVVASIK
jgi:hypothetical protein